MPQWTDLTGRKFDKLTAIRPIGTNSSKKMVWYCQCDCGKSTKSIGSNLISGQARTCGCTRKANALAKIITHGLTYSKVYSTWGAIKTRCYNTKNEFYHLYGGRGVTVCSRWVNSFENFFEDMGHPPSSKHSIDRIDPYGNYEPSNCRWATALEQAHNKRYKAAKAHCRNGHEYSPENVYRAKDGRICRICMKIQKRVSNAKRREKLSKYRESLIDRAIELRREKHEPT